MRGTRCAYRASCSPLWHSVAGFTHLVALPNKLPVSREEFSVVVDDPIPFGDLPRPVPLTIITVHCSLPKSRTHSPQNYDSLNLICFFWLCFWFRWQRRRRR